MTAGFGHPYDLSWQALNKMKGQAVPLASFHVVRDQLLPMITGEYQNIILYWAGRNLASQFNPPDLDSLAAFFLELGWGELTLERDQPLNKTFRLSSPFFSQRQVEKNPATFALECGFLTEALAILEKREAEGEFELIQDKREGLSIQFTVHLAAEQHPQRGEAEKTASYEGTNDEVPSIG